MTSAQPEQHQRIDIERPEIPIIPPGFLSPSVQEYLELGKSIPGKLFHAVTKS